MTQASGDQNKIEIFQRIDTKSHDENVTFVQTSSLGSNRRTSKTKMHHVSEMKRVGGLDADGNFVLTDI